MDKVKKILLITLGIILMIALMFVFIYVFIFLVVIGFIYYIYRRFFKRKPKGKKYNKQIGTIVIDMEDD